MLTAETFEHVKLCSCRSTSLPSLHVEHRRYRSVAWCKLCQLAKYVINMSRKYTSGSPRQSPAGTMGGACSLVAAGVAATHEIHSHVSELLHDVLHEHWKARNSCSVDYMYARSSKVAQKGKQSHTRLTFIKSPARLWRPTMVMQHKRQFTRRKGGQLSIHTPMPSRIP